MHLHLWVLPPIYEAYPDIAAWKKIATITGAFRLPVLFALSGFLISDRVRAGWDDRRNVLRASTSYYLYVVWLAIYAALSISMPGSQPVGVSAVGFWKQLLVPQTPLWFVMFLAIHVVILTTLHKVHPAVILGGAAFVSFLTIRLSLPSEFAMVERGFYYLFFFALGVYGKQILIYFGSKPGLWWRAPATAAVALIGIDILRRVPGSAFGYIGAIYLRDVGAILCIVSIMSAVCMIRPLGRVLGFIGSRTLPAYVMHVPLIWGIIAARPVYMPFMEIPSVRFTAPVLALILIIGSSLLIHAVLMRFAIGRVLFDMPSPVKKLILGRESERTAA